MWNKGKLHGRTWNGGGSITCGENQFKNQEKY